MNPNAKRKLGKKISELKVFFLTLFQLSRAITETNFIHYSFDMRNLRNSCIFWHLFVNSGLLQTLHFSVVVSPLLLISGPEVLLG